MHESPMNRGSMLVPVILGSNKTTVSVATGQNEYWLVYMFKIMFGVLIAMALFLSHFYQFQKVSFPLERITQS